MKETGSVFSLDIDVTFGVSVILMLLCFLPGFFPAVLGGSEAQRRELSAYLYGVAVGIPFLMIGSQLSGFLQLEQQEKRTYIGIAAMTVLNMGLNLLFVWKWNMGFLGLGLATSAANLIYCVIQISWFLTDRATIRFRVRSADFSYLSKLFRLGFPGALVQACIIIRGLLSNRILLRFCSPWGLPAYAAVNTLCLLYYAVYIAMSSAIRLLTSIYLEEMVSNIIVHGFVPEKRNEIIVRLIRNKEDLIISIRDDCRPFNPKERELLFDPEDPTHNIGIRMVSHFSRKMEYRFLLGMNVLTMTI